MDELELELNVIVANIEELVRQLRETPKKSTEYNYIAGQIAAYTDIQNLIMFRLNKLRNGGK